MANGGSSMVLEPLRYIAAADISGDYASIGGTFQHPIRILEINNLTNETLIFSLSLNGDIEDQFVVPGNTGKVWDICAARSGGDWGASFIAKNTFVAVYSPTASATGDGVYVSAWYIFGD